jgi:hypothetical protein
MGNVAENAPFPQVLTPLTVKFPEVAIDEKVAVIAAVVDPVEVNPTPEYDHE